LRAAFPKPGPREDGRRRHILAGVMIDRYISWRDARAQPKTSFGRHSVIRTWIYY
jgi:hypothetical protein